MYAMNKGPSRPGECAVSVEVKESMPGARTIGRAFPAVAIWWLAQVETWSPLATAQEPWAPWFIGIIGMTETDSSLPTMSTNPT